MNYTNYEIQQADEFDKLVLIGIVSTSDLKHAELFKGGTVCPILYFFDYSDNSIVSNYFYLKGCNYV